MSKMPNIIISNTICFIILTKIRALDLLLKVYGRILTTSDIAEEFGEKLPEWVIIVDVLDKYKQKILELQIDKGESSAIALAIETPDSMILDDFRLGKLQNNLDLSLQELLVL